MKPSISLQHMKTPAKVNLYFEIVGKRSDGYHDIRTIFYPLKELFDTLEISLTETRGVTMACNSAEVPLDERNLCVRAALNFAQEAKLEPCWHIDLEKRIPIAAGCGGGSSDAAATLLILNRMYKHILSTQHLGQIACRLGADVPYFLAPSLMLGEGIGEQLTPFSIRLPSHLGILLLNLKFPVSAAWAYRHYGLHDKKMGEFSALMAALQEGDAEHIMDGMHNDFDRCLFEKFPILEELKVVLQQFGHRCVHVSGSGPTLFVVDDFERLHETYLKLGGMEQYANMLWMHIEQF